MALEPGRRLGGYEIQGSLGAGGMGEVYRARDTKLGRSVAVKVLPEAVRSDAERIARFQREAKLLASLNHPHIAALFGMEESEGRHFLVMELVEGETLAERITSAARRGSPGPGLPVKDALRIALQIAEALEAAHEAGIIHRDLKPANVKIAPDGRVKVLDFGLARAMDPRSSVGVEPSVTNSPTLSVMATQAGVILGTAAYMSPEQAKGLQADTRSDIFSFGVVLYEMLTGRQPFQGETAADIVASVLIREADLAALPPNLNPRLGELIKRCLEKNPKRRWQAVGDLRADLESIAAAPLAAPSAQGHTHVPLWRRALPAAVAAMLTAAICAGIAWRFWPTPLMTVTRFTVMMPQGMGTPNRAAVAISPDGSAIAFVANDRLYLRSMRDLEPRPIIGSEGGGPTTPVFSPDGSSIAYFSLTTNTLKRINVSGGVAETVCPGGPPFGASWGDDGIVFGQRDSILRVPANGGKPVVLASFKSGETPYAPQMLANGAVLLFTLASGTGRDRWDAAQVVVQSLRSGERKVLIDGGSEAKYLSSGHIVYAVGTGLFAVRFDLPRLEVTGAPVPVVEGVRRTSNPLNTGGTAQYSVSEAGTLVFIPGPALSARRRDLAFIDSGGRVTPLKLPPGPFTAPRISPDGTRVVFGSDDGKDASVWIYELAGTMSPRQLTLSGINRFPIWSADGQRVVFQSDREGDAGLFWQRADGTGPVERLTKSEPGESHVPESWSPSGDTLIFGKYGRSVSLWTLSLRRKTIERFGDAESREMMDAVFSPDGRWVAYDATDGAIMQSNVYVEPFPRTGARYVIAPAPLAGARNPFWSPDGRSLTYATGPGDFAMVTISTDRGFAFSNPSPVPRGPLAGGDAGAPSRRNYDPAGDGKRILGVIDPLETGVAPTQLQVVLNWQEELKQRVSSR